ncbi:hypothetical protein [Brevundimonas bacteroides]|uniref:hypothetical protein n=1 Tax=Brevundimonas bacteroides TaxID=74311 RepID=UPI0012EE2E48|nr:hypothetical protein [Brevundimonas bacteroides]
MEVLLVGPFDWLMGRLLDYFADRQLTADPTDDNLDNFDPRDLEYASYLLNGDVVYGQEGGNSWYVDQAGDGDIDAHVVRDNMGYYWADVGNGYVNVGQNPSGDGS